MTFHALGFAQPGTTFGEPGGIQFAPGPNQPIPFQPQPQPFDPFDLPDPGNTIIKGIQAVGCGVSKFIGCNHPISRPIWESLCGPCEAPIGGVLDPDALDQIVPSQPIPARPAQGPNGCVPCGPNECRVQVGVDRCGQPRFRKGRMVVDPSTGAGVCIPKKPRMNPMNAKANRRSMSRLKGAHREAKKIIDTLDTFAKPRRSKAPRARAAAGSACSVCK